MSKKIRLAGIAYESLVNGPGMRRVYFLKGADIIVKDVLIQILMILMEEKSEIWMNS